MFVFFPSFSPRNSWPYPTKLTVRGGDCRDMRSRFTAEGARTGKADRSGPPSPPERDPGAAAPAPSAPSAPPPTAAALRRRAGETSAAASAEPRPPPARSTRDAQGGAGTCPCPAALQRAAAGALQRFGPAAVGEGGTCRGRGGGGQPRRPSGGGGRRGRQLALPAEVTAGGGGGPPSGERGGGPGLKLPLRQSSHPRRRTEATATHRERSGCPARQPSGPAREKSAGSRPSLAEPYPTPRPR